MANLLKNPTTSLFYGTKVEEIMESDPVIVSRDTKYKELIDYWKERGRAYAIIPNDGGFILLFLHKRFLGLVKGAGQILL